MAKLRTPVPKEWSKNLLEILAPHAQGSGRIMRLDKDMSKHDTGYKGRGGQGETSGGYKIVDPKKSGPSPFGETGGF